MTPASRSSQVVGYPKKQKTDPNGGGKLVSEKQIQSPKGLQEHNKQTGTADNPGAAGTEDISCGGWPDTKLPSYTLQVQECNPHKFNSTRKKTRFLEYPKELLSKKPVLNQ